MKRFLFILSLVCSILAVIFWLSSVSLNGYNADIIFWAFTACLNIVTCIVLIRAKAGRFKTITTGIIGGIMMAGFIYYNIDEDHHVHRVITCWMAKQNLYSSGTGVHYKAYFERHGHGNSGEKWETKVPVYFPIIEIEYHHNDTFHIPADTDCFKIKQEE